MYPVGLSVPQWMVEKVKKTLAQPVDWVCSKKLVLRYSFITKVAVLESALNVFSLKPLRINKLVNLITGNVCDCRYNDFTPLKHFGTSIKFVEKKEVKEDRVKCPNKS